MSSEEEFKFLSSAIVPKTPSERSQHEFTMAFVIIIARRRETEQPRERKRAPSSFLAYSRYENRKTDELRNDVLFFVFRDRSDDAFGTISA